MEEKQKNSKDFRKLIFNPEGDREASKRKIILGNPTNLIELNEIKYGWAFDLYKTMAFSNFWIPEEIELIDEKVQYKTSLTEHEKRAYDLTLSFLIALDSFQVDFLKDLGGVVTSPEIEMAITAQEFQESVHAYSYQYILESVLPPDKTEEIYNYWREDEKLRDRIKVIAENYNEFVKDKNPQTFYRACISDYILESLYFYSGFAFFYTLGRQDKMINTVNQIKLINRDELCFLPDHCVLTDKGFKRFEDLTKDDKVLSYDIDNKVYKFTDNYEKIEKEYDGYVYEVKLTDNLTVTATEDHEFILYDLKLAKYIKIPVQKISEISGEDKLNRYLIPLSLNVNSKHDGVVGYAFKHSLDILSSLIKGLYPDKNELVIKHNSRRYIEENFYGTDYDYYVLEEFNNLDNISGIVYFKTKEDLNGVEYHLDLTKDDIKPLTFKDLSYATIQILTGSFLDYIVDYTENNIILYDKQLLDIFLTLSSMIGLKFKVKEIKNNDEVIYILEEEKSLIPLSKIEITKKEYKGKVYCVSTIYSNILVKTKDSFDSLLVGNCHVSLFRNIIQTLHEEYPQLKIDNEKWVYEQFKYAVDQEVNWGKYVTQNQILGLTDSLIEKYIKYLANLRLTQIGFKALYPDVTENPLKWIDEFRKINNTKTDFFQRRPIAYSKRNELKW